MKKLILSLGVLAALSAPALAQSTYENSAGNRAAGGNSGVATPGGPNDFTKQAVDPATTNSVAPDSMNSDQSILPRDTQDGTVDTQGGAMGTQAQ